MLGRERVARPRAVQSQPRPVTGVHHPRNPEKLSVLKASILAECPFRELQSIDRLWPEVVLGLGTQSGECGAGLRVSSGFRWLWAFTSGCWSIHGSPAGTDGLLPTGHDGNAQSGRDCNARGEILRPLHDQPQRRRSARACSSIKNESVGSKDDQTPS